MHARTGTRPAYCTPVWRPARCAMRPGSATSCINCRRSQACPVVCAWLYPAPFYSIRMQFFKALPANYTPHARSFVTNQTNWTTVSFVRAPPIMTLWCYACAYIVRRWSGMLTAASPRCQSWTPKPLTLMGSQYQCAVHFVISVARSVGMHCIKCKQSLPYLYFGVPLNYNVPAVWTIMYSLCGACCGNTDLRVARAMGIRDAYCPNESRNPYLNGTGQLVNIFSQQVWGCRPFMSKYKPATVCLIKFHHLSC